MTAACYEYAEPRLNGNSCQCRLRHAKRDHTMATGFFGSTRRAAPGACYCFTTLRDLWEQTRLPKTSRTSAREPTDAQSVICHLSSAAAILVSSAMISP